MDPGAELNLVRKSLVDDVSKRLRIKVHAREKDELILMNNGKVVAHVYEAVYLTFVLDAPDERATYSEWFHLLEDMDEEMLLGSQFCKEHNFTSFHSRLTPWTDELSNKRSKRVREVQQTTAAPAMSAINTSIPYERPSETPNAERYAELSRHGWQYQPPPRQRVVTTCEKIDQHAKKHATRALQEEFKPLAGQRRANKKQFTPVLQPNTHENHSPVQYNCVQSRQLSTLLQQRAIDSQKTLYKTLKQLSETNVTLTFDEAEVLRDTARLCALEASKVFDNSAKGNRYFMDDEQPATVAQQSKSQKYTIGQCVTLQNLQTHADLNGKPARIVNFDDANGKYAISVAVPRGYWWASEDKLKAIDPRPAPDDFASCGIDPASGQPTLDPLERPVHRQYGKNYSIELTAKIQALIEKYKHVFGKDITKPCKFKPMKIDLIPNAVLPRNPRYWKNSPAQREEVRTQLQSMIAMGVVSASTTAIVSNVLLVKRPGMPGKFRFTIDFRDLNDATVPQPFQMPEVQSQLDRLAGNCVFGCIDLSSYYHQIELDSGSKFLTGFITEDGVFEYQRVPMGLKNACAHAQSQLQGAIDADPILAKYGLRNYFDDLPLAAKSEEEFLEQMEAVLKLGEHFNLKFNLDKSIFGVDSITHCGFIVKAGGVEVDPQRIESLRAITSPKSMKGVQSVLGTWNYIRNFIPNFSTRALSLTNLVGSKAKSKAFLWTEECEAAFNDLKSATLDTKLLANMNYALPIYIRSDSSQFGAGAVLFQFDELGRECPIAYASRKYTMAERNYCTFQQEAAAVVWSLEKFANFHQGHHVIVQSDHKNLSWVKRTAMPQLTRWRLRLQDFDFSLEYYAGVKNVVADGLSRQCVDDADINISMRDFLPEHAAQQSFLQGAVPMRTLNTYSVRKRCGPVTATAAERVWEATLYDATAPDAFSFDDDETATLEPKLSHNAKDEQPETDTMLNSDVRAANFAPLAAHVEQGADADAAPIPHLDHEAIPADASEINRTLQTVHNAVVGHNGVLVTLNRVLRADKQWATRKEMIDHIDQFISGCTICQKYRKRHNRRTDERFVISGNPFAELSVDILKLPKRDCNGNLYVVVIVDSFSRWVSLEPVPDKTALSASRAIIRTMGTFGVPLTIRSDGGKEFINDTLAGVEFLLGVTHHKIMPYQHEGNSLAEKANRSVLENLRNIIFDKRYVLNGEHQWSDLLPLVQRIMNASFNSSIGCSPASLIFGSNIDLDRCLITPNPQPAVNTDVPEYIQMLTHNQRIVMDAAEKQLSATHAKNLSKWKSEHKTDLTLQHKMQTMTEDTPVWVLARVKDDAPRAKWAPKWAGPYRLLDFKTGSQSVVRVFDTVSGKVIEAHINDVALWDARFVSSVEGVTAIAETDGWSYPIDGIVGIALDPEDDDIPPVALPLDRARTNSNKYKYLFAVKWRGYEETSWEPFRAVENTSSFSLFAAHHPLLKLAKQ